MSLSNSESLNLKSFLFIFSRDNILITICIFIISLALGDIYYKQKTPMYKSYISIELPERNILNRQGVGVENIINNITTPTVTDVETEIDIIKSKNIISKALDYVQMDVRYHIKDTFREIELFEPPFKITDISLRNMDKIKFEFIPVDEKRFKLKVASSKSKYNIYNYNDKISLNKGSFIIKKTKKSIPKQKYYFKITNKQKIIKDIQKRMSVTPSSLRSSLLVIEYKDTNPDKLQKFLNTLGKVYIEENIKKRTHAASSTLKFINEQLKKVKQSLEKSALVLKNFKKENSIIDIATKTKELIDSSIKTKEEYEKANIDLKAFESIRKEFLKGNFSALGGMGVRYPLLDTLIEELDKTRIQRDTLLIDFTKIHPNVVKLQKNINRLKSSISRIIKGIEKDLKKRKEILQKRVNFYNYQIKNLPTKEQTFANLQRDYQVNENLYSYLLREKSQFSIAKAARVSDTKIIDYAERVSKPFSPNKALVFGVSAFLGLLFAMFVLFVKEKLDPKIKNLNDFFRLTNLPVFGMIPYIKDKTLYNKVYVLYDPNSKESEVYRKIRTELEFIQTEGKCKTILLTSFVPNERKTVVCANLGAIFGMGHKKTLVISFDFTTPQLHKKFSIPNIEGVCDILEGGMKLKDLIFEHPLFPKLHILPSGAMPKNRYDLVNSDITDKLLKYLKTKYDFIIIDTSPVDVVPDALLLTKYADINIFVARMNYSKKSYIKSINETVKKYKIKNAGFIINSIKSKELNSQKYDKGYLYYANY